MSSKKMFLIMLITLILITMGGAWASDDHAVDEVSAADDDAIAVDSVDDTQKDTSVIKENLTSQKNDEAVKAVDSESNQKGEILSASNDEDLLTDDGAGGNLINLKNFLNGKTGKHTLSGNYINSGSDYGADSSKVSTKGITINNALELEGTKYGSDMVTIDAGNGGSLFYISAGSNTVVFKNLKFINAAAKYTSAAADYKGGVAFVESGTVTFQDCIFENNYAHSGGAVASTKESSSVFNLNFINCNFTNDYTKTVSGVDDNKNPHVGGAIYSSRGNLNISGCRFNECYVDTGGQGGAIAIIGDESHYLKLNIENSLFKSNKASKGTSDNNYAGCIFMNYIDSGSGIKNSRFEDNEAETGIGNIALQHLKSGSTFRIDNSNFTHNCALGKRGGALTVYFSDNANLVIDGCKFENNTAGGDRGGGAIALNGLNSVKILNSKFIHNYVTGEDNGGAISFNTTIHPEYFVINNTNFTQNHAVSGGAIYIVQPTTNINITYCNFTDNYATTESDRSGGGAVYIPGGISGILIEKCKFKNNRVGVNSNGGAVFFGGLSDNINIIDSSFDLNNASTGGAVQFYADNSKNEYYHNINILNSNFTANHVEGGGYYGGSALCFNHATGVDILGCNFEKNTANYGTVFFDYCDDITFDGCNFTKNNATIAAAGVYYNRVNNDANSTFNNCLFDGNIAEMQTESNYQAGVIYLRGGNHTFTANTFKNNRNDKNGGVIFANSTADVTFNSKNKFIGNEALNGGALYLADSTGITINDAVFDNNIAQEDGGAIYFMNTTGEVSNTAISGSNAILIDSDSNVTLTRNNNTANTGDYSVENNGTLSLSKNIFANVIINNGVITSSTNTTVLDNDTVDADLDDNATLYAKIVDDNNNIIIIPTLEFIVNATTHCSLDSTDKTYHYGKYLTTDSGEYVVTVNTGDKLGANTINPGVLNVKIPKTEIEFNVTQEKEGEIVTVTATIKPPLGKTTTGTLVVTLYDMDNKVIQKQTQPAGDSIAATFKFNNLTPDAYKVKGVYTATDSKFNAEGSDAFVVKMRDVNMSVEVKNIANGQNATAIINVTANNGTVTLVINGRDEKEVEVSRGINEIDLGQLTPGNYTLSAYYAENDYYKFQRNSTTFEVYAYDMIVDVSDAQFNKTSTITVTLPSDATGEVEIYLNGVKLEGVTGPVDGVYTVETPVFSEVGDKTLNVTYKGNDKYYAKNFTDTVTVNPNSVYDFNVEVTPQPVDFGKDLTINITGPAGLEVNVTIDGVDQTVTLDQNGEYVITLNNLTAGPHSIVANTTANGNYSSKGVSESFTISPAKPELTIDVTEPISPNAPANVTVTVGPNATGTVAVYIDGKLYDSVDVDEEGKAVIPISDTSVPGTYNVTVKYVPGENDNYKASSNNEGKNYTIDRYDSTVTSNVTVRKDNHVIVTVTVDGASDDSNVTFTLSDGTNVTENIVNGVATFDLGIVDVQGFYNFTATFNGDETLNTNFTTGNFTVAGLNNYTVNVSISDTQYGDNTTIKVTMEEEAIGGTVTVYVNDKPYTADLIGNEYVVVTEALAVGNYTVNVTYSGKGSVYAPQNNTGNKLEVKTNSSYEFKVDVTSAPFGGNTTINITGPAGENVTVTIDGINQTVTLNENGTYVITVNDLGAGSHNVTATIPDSVNYTSKSVTEKFTIDRQVPSMEIIVPSQPIAAGSTANIVVKVGDNATGNVTVYIDNVRYEVHIVDGEAVLPINTTKAGTFSVTAQYLGDENYTSGANNTAQKYTVNKYDITMTYTNVTVAPNNTVTFEVTLNETGAKGEVVITVGDKNYTAAVENGVAKVAVGPLAQNATEYIFTAVYSGDEKYNSTKVDVNVTVGKLRNGTMDISIVPNPGQYGQSVNITVTVPGATDGNVTVNVNGTPYPAKEVAPGVYEVIVSDLPVGDYPINVTYGNGTRYDEFKNSTAMSIGKNSTYDFGIVIEPKDNVKYGDNVTINVTGLPRSEVEIIVDGVVYDTVTIGDDGKASRVYNNLTAATHTIVANYSGNGSYEGRVAQDTITIVADDPEMIIKIVPGENVAPASDANITVFIGKNATGTAIIYINGTPTEVPVVDGVATLSINTTVPGTYNVTAKYLGDDGNYVSGVNNTGILYTIEKYDVSMENLGAVVAPNNEVTFTVKLNVTDAKGDIVYIEYDGKNYTGVVDENGVAQVTVGPLNQSVDEYKLNAVYNGSSKYATANVTVNATVGKLRNGTMDISIVPNPGQYGQSVNITVTVPGATDGNVTVNVNGTPYPAKEVAPGVYEVIVSDLPVGDYPINVTYGNGTRYDEFKNSTAMSIGKNSTYDFGIVIEPKDNVKYGDNVTINVTGLPGSEVEIIVDGVVYDTVTIGGDGKASRVYNNLTAATHTIVANYSGNESYEGAVAQDTITIVADDPEMIIKIVPGENVAPASDANITVFIGKNATGTAIIYIDGTPNNVPVVDGFATLPINTTVPGTHNVTAMYLGDDGNYVSGVNNTGILYTIEKYDVSMENLGAVVAPNNEVTFTVKLNVTDAKGDIVYIEYDGKNYTGVVDENGVAQVTVGPMAASDAEYNLNAVYNGSSKYATANVTVNTTVGKLRNGTMDISIIPNPAQFADSINITVTVPDATDGNVTVDVNGTPYPAKEVAPGVYEVIITDLPVGDYPINVTYGNGSRYDNFTDSTSLSVKGNSSYEFNVDVSPAKYGEDTVITVTAPAGLGQVNVTVDDEVYVVDIDPATGKGTLTLDNISAGNHNVTASFAGNNNYSAKNTTTEYFTVYKQVPSMEIIVPTEPIAAGSTANIVVKVGDNATGNVTVYINNVRHEVPVENGVATLPIDTNKAGTFTVTAQYLGDENYTSGANSTAQEYTVNKYDISMTYVGATVATYNTVTFKIEFNETDAKGEVTIAVGDKNYTGIVDGGVAEVVVGPLDQKVDEYKFTAVYSGDEKYNTTDVEVNVTVGKLRNGTMTVDLIPNPSQFGDSVNVTVTIPDVTDGNVTVKIGEDSYNAERQPDGTYVAIVPALPVGDHPINVTYTDGSRYDNFYDDSQSIHTDANGSYFFDVDVAPAKYGNDTVITVTAPAGVAEVNVTVDGETHIVKIDPATGKGTLTLNNISAGLHNVTASFDGNKNYTGRELTETFTVPKQDSVVDVTVPGGEIPVNAKENITVFVGNNATGDAIVYVDNVPITVTVENGIATVPIDTTKPGVHNVTAKYFGDKNYTAGQTSAVTQYTVGKYDTTMEIVEVTRDDDNNVTVKVKVNGTEGNVTIKIGDKTYNATVGEDGIAEVNIGNAPVGSTDINVTYSGDDNFAQISAIETINVPVVKTYDMPVTSEDIGYGKDAKVNITLPDGAKLDNLTVYLNDVEYDITGKYEQIGNTIVVTIPDLKAGEYTVRAAYADDGVYGDSKNSTTFTVEKVEPVNPEIIINQPIDVGEDLNITVKLPEDATGEITVVVNGTKYVFDLVNGSVNISIPNLGNGTYDVNVTYGGDDNYDPISENDTVVVNKVDPVMDAATGEIILGENAVINVTMPSDVTGTVTIKIEGVDEPITAPVSGGQNSIIVPGVPVGTHSVEITYNGDGKYENKTIATTLTVNPKPTSADDFKVEDKGNGTIIVTAPEGATGQVNLTIGNETYTVDIVDGKAVFDIANETNQTPGKHNITLNYSGDKNNKPVEFNETANVPQWSSTVSVDIPTIREGDIAKVNVTVTSTDDRGYVPTGNVRVVVDGKGYSGVLKDGSVIIEVPGLAEGPHDVEVYYDGDNYYLANETKGNVKVERKITAEVVGTGNSSQVVIDLPGNGTVEAFIDGQSVPVSPNEDGIAKVNLTGVLPGKHNVTVKYTDANGTISEVTEEIIVPPWDSSVEASAKTIREGDVAKVVVTVGSKDMNGTVTVKVNGAGYTVDITDGTAIVEIPGLTNNTYDAVVIYNGNEKYLPSNNTFQIAVEAPLVINVNGTGNSSQVVIDLPGNGTVEAFIDGNRVDPIIENGTAKVNLTGLEPGKHNITVRYTDEDGTVSEVTQEIIVPPWDSSVEASAKTIREGDVANIVVKVGDENMTGEVKVDIDGTGYYAQIVNGEVTIKAPGIKAGTYVGNVTYGGNEKYLASNNTFTLVVEEPIVIDINGTGNSSQVVIDLPANGTKNVTVTIDGNPVDVDFNNRTAVANLTGLEPGDHNITVVYTDADGTQSVVNQQITVPKWDSSVEASAKTIREGDVANIVVKVGDENMTGEVKVDIDGTGYYAPIVNGEVTINAPGLKAGTYVGNVTYGGNEKYLASNNTFTLVVEEPIVIDINGTGNSSQVVIDLPANGTNNVAVTIDGNPVDVDFNNRTAVANLTGLEPGDHNITVVYTDADGTQSVVNQQITVPKWDSSVNATAATIREGDTANIVIKVGDENMTGEVKVDIDGTGYYAPIVNGEVVISAPGIKSGTYVGNVTYEGNDKYLPSSNTFTIVVEEPIVIDIEGAGNSTEVIVELPNNGTDMQNLTVLVDGKEVPVTIVNGTAVADLNNMTPGEHNVAVIYTDKQGTQSVANKTITVFNSIKANDMTRGWASPYDYEAEFLDKDGHVIANTTMQFKVNGKTYTVKTDNKGIAKLTESKLPVGAYEVEITNLQTGEVVKHNLTIVKRIVENKDLTMDFLDGSQYVVRAIGDNGQPVGAGEVVKFSANGKNYASVTDSKGYAKLTISLNPKKYTITAHYAAYTVSNNLKVKQTLKLVKKTVKVKKTAKKLVIKAKLKWSNGKAIKGKKLTLKFKGKTYKAKTNKKGIAKFTIKKKVIKKLKKGKKYKYSVAYKTNIVKGKVKVKK